MSDFKCQIKLIAVIFILMFSLNAAVLHFCFGIRYSDLAGLIKAPSEYNEADSFGSGPGDSGAGFPAGDNSGDGDGSAGGSDEYADPGDRLLADGNGAGTSAEGSDIVENNPPVDIPELTNIIDLINNLSFMDKITLAGILTRIDSDELKRIYAITVDGVNAEEMSTIREYAKNSLKPSDVEKLEDMYSRNRHLYAQAGE